MPEPTHGAMPEADVVERLERFETGRATALPATEVRRRGERRRRRTRAAVAVAAAAAAAAVVVPVTLLLGGDRGGTPEPAPVVTDVPDDFPLDAGMSDDDREVTVDGPIGVTMPWVDPSLCGADVWPDPGEDALSVQEVGPEYGRARVLATYANAQRAGGVLEALRDAVSECPTSREYSYATDVTAVDVDTGEEAVTFTSVFSSGRPFGHVYQFVRVGNAVLATADTGEYTASSARAGVDDLTEANAPVVQAMCVFADDGCG